LIDDAQRPAYIENMDKGASLAGNLHDFSIYDILTMLHVGQKTGLLLIEKDQEMRKLFLHQGYIVYAHSSDYRDSTSKYLIDNDYITKEKLKKAFDALANRKTKKTVLDLLIAKRYISEKQLKHAARENISRIIYSIFRWKKGIFRFYNKGQLPQHAVIVKIDPTNLVMEGARQEDEWERVHKDFPNERLILKVNPDLNPAETDIHLNDMEWKVLAKVNGYRSVIDICRDIRYIDEFETLKMLASLYRRHIVLPSGIATGEETDPEESTITYTIFNLETIRQSKQGPGGKKPSTGAGAKRMPPPSKASIMLRAKIVKMVEGIKEHTIILSDERCIIGKDPHCDIPIDNMPTLPEQYAMIRPEGMSYIIRSLADMPLNINNTMFKKKELENYDEINIGDVSLIFSKV